MLTQAGCVFPELGYNGPSFETGHRPLIKIKIFAADRDARREIIVQVSTQAGAELIQSIGNIAVLYRASAKPDPRLSNILRHKAH